MELQRNYLAQKQRKKKSTVKGLWIIFALAIVFIVIIAKFALSGDNDINTLFSGMPSNNEVYNIAKQFVLPTLKGSGASFSEQGYEYGKKADSVFIIRSVVNTKTNGGDTIKTNFEITLKYKGGAVTDESSWKILNLNED
ncbi:MAG: hypothetical protein ACHQF4_02000 [Sphingobacteriales bacterium]